MIAGDHYVNVAESLGMNPGSMEFEAARKSSRRFCTSPSGEREREGGYTGMYREHGVTLHGHTFLATDRSIHDICRVSILFLIHPCLPAIQILQHCSKNTNYQRSVLCFPQILTEWPNKQTSLEIYTRLGNWCGPNRASWPQPRPLRPSSRIQSVK